MKDKLLRLKELSDRLNELCDKNMELVTEVEQMLSEGSGIGIPVVYKNVWCYGRVSGKLMFYYLDNNNNKIPFVNLSRVLKIEFGSRINLILDEMEKTMIKSLEGKHDHRHFDL